MVVRRRLAGHRDPVALRGPVAEVDHLATLAAERAPPVLRAERRGCPAARAGDGFYRLQKVSSKPTSQSAVRGLGSSPFWARKRMLSTYLLALISGTQGVSTSRRTRSICAILPPSICWWGRGGACSVWGLPDSRRILRMIAEPSRSGYSGPVQAASCPLRSSAGRCSQ